MPAILAPGLPKTLDSSRGKMASLPQGFAGAPSERERGSRRRDGLYAIPGLRRREARLAETGLGRGVGGSFRDHKILVRYAVRLEFYLVFIECEFDGSVDGDQFPFDGLQLPYVIVRRGRPDDILLAEQLGLFAFFQL
jgi:hypothetical protein